MEIQGRVKQIFPSQTMGQNGFEKRDLVIITEDIYPQTTIIQFTQQRCDLLDSLQVGKIYDYGAFKVSPIKLYHDVPNFGWRIFLPNGKKIFHATDTVHLEGITAKGYDLYAIEHNYCEEYIQQAIEEARANGEYTHAYGNINTHLSIQQARAFIEANRKESSEVLELHKSRSFYK